MALDTDVLIVGAGMSGLGLAVQLRKKLGHKSFTLIEKTEDVGGTWLVNTYPNCGCDVASHFYSYSFALNPDWTRKYSMREEIQAYFRTVADQYNIIPHVKFHSTVEQAVYHGDTATWTVVVKDQKTEETRTMRSKILVTAVGSLSVPNPCEIQGVQVFRGRLFHSAQWDHGFDWKDKNVVVIGNGCSATQFVPRMTGGSGAVRSLTQFSRQAHFLAERTNPEYSNWEKAIFRYVPFAMRLYRLKLYADMEKDFSGFDIDGGAKIRSDLLEENEAYVKKTAPPKYWDAVLPKHEPGCKRKVLDTDYLSCLWRDNMELVSEDPVEQIVEDGVKTKGGRFIKADAIILATGFATHKLLFPMKITGEDGTDLHEYWDKQYDGAPQAYLGTIVPHFPNMFICMGPNTVTGHLSVIYTVECQIEFILNLISPILESLRPSRSLLRSFTTGPDAVAVRPEAAERDSSWMQRKLKTLVWASGCTSWALHPTNKMNVAMYPDWQFLFWWRSVFVRAADFEYRDTKTGKKRSLVVGGWKKVERAVLTTAVLAVLASGVLGLRKRGSWAQWISAIQQLKGNGISQVKKALSG